MRIIFILFICAEGIAATCLTTINEKEREIARKFPGRLVKWNRQSLKFEIIAAFNQNYTSVCSVDFIDDLTGKTIVITGEFLLPYLGLNPDNSLTGYLGDIWTTLEEALKFRTEFRPARHSSGETLKRGEADVWLAAIAIFYRANGHMVYSHQIAANYYGLYTMFEGHGVSKWWYMNIFSRGLWAMSFMFVVGITALLLVMYRFKRAICRDYEECNNQLAITSFNLLSVLGVMTGQGFQEIPTAWSLRVIILSAVIMGMLISCGFSSTLTSYLTIQGNTLLFNNLADVTRTKTHTLCVRNQSWPYDELIDMAKNDTNNWSNIINKDCQNMDNAIEFGKKLCRPGVVYVEAPEVFYPVYHRILDKCPIVQIPGEYWSSKIAFLHARGSPHRSIIDRYLLRLRSAGILHYLERKWISKKSPTSHDRQLKFKTVEYDHIDIISIALIGMIFVSGFICILENIWFRLESRRARKNMEHLRSVRLHDFLLKATNFRAAELDPKTIKLWTTNTRNQPENYY